MTSARPTDAEVIAAYARTGSVWVVGRELGIAGQTVHKRLRKCGAPARPINVLTSEERERIAAYYQAATDETFDLSALAQEIGRTRQFICRHARSQGLTRPGRPHLPEVSAAAAKKNSERIKRDGHPRGMLGKTHTAELRIEIGRLNRERWARDKAFGIGNMSESARDKRSRASSERMIRRMNDPTKPMHTRALGGRADDLGDTWFRSSWERNYARYLNLLIKMKIIEHWDYEKEVFWFEGIRRGCTSYRPDFRVKYRNVAALEYVEVKGWVTPKDHTKWRRMKKYHPHIRLVVVGAKEYREIAQRWASAIPTWESGKRLVEAAPVAVVGAV